MEALPTLGRGIAASSSVGHHHFLVSLHNNPHHISQAVVKLVAAPAMSLWVRLNVFCSVFFPSRSRKPQICKKSI